MTFSYHKISSDDVNSLIPIENACHSHPWSEKTFNSCIGTRYFGHYLQVNNELVGFYVGEHVAGEATLMDVCVLPALQGKGYGKALLEHFFVQSKQLNNTLIWLEVRAKNISAQMMYINHGFIETGRRTGYYPSASGFGYEDAIVMKKVL
ncbi:ribosomal-protein-alanine N-acetyltransferase [Colwellia hornerae]|uniref:[Ribosomal protein bS18]-alanine N-acetyltransferase n=2 Tax=Colwellia hornerae TaxID=89402 RepID=A0A5C6QD45_9GAMM|nr:ribosomal-protein-alanine N-acetyltransferase [Colwellia hornerae]TWX57492.1 ribosomal-protein-alanine N-acetyltransferase [Colwellia hornerae]TWX66995.1 ribosomal-protein-alanine N-acetyltransferase [Colwellia hornerae]